MLGRQKLGESRIRLVIPAWHPVLERVYIYKTAHHPRLETDYKQPAIDAAMATAAAPTFLKPHMTECEEARSRDPTGINQIIDLRRRSASGPRAETQSAFTRRCGTTADFKSTRPHGRRSRPFSKDWIDSPPFTTRLRRANPMPRNSNG